MKEKKWSRPLPQQSVRVEDAFWSREQELVRREVLPYQWNALNDRVEGAAPSFCMRNFRVAARIQQEKKEKGADYEARKYAFRGFNALPKEGEGPKDDDFYGFVFQDSDFSKWIEAVAYSLVVHPDEELSKIADEAIDIVCAAQEENGYLDTYYIINGMDGIFTNLKDHHEFYCMGHLIEGAVAYYEATGKDKLLNAARRFADFVADRFGEESEKLKGYPGHEISEMALVRLAEVTGDDRYMNLARFFIDARGQQPCYFAWEEKTRSEKENRNYQSSRDNFAYYQAHQPVREQKEAVGHAVRAGYLYSGMADVARVTNDDAMIRAVKALWHSITNEKMYITGGVGATHLGESFSFPYDLPSDTAYNETCASVALVFFARRMLELEPRSEYADVMERALYNGVLSGMALDGKSFFYVNPLTVQPKACRLDGRKEHVKSTRQKWFGCACCPPNLARLIGSLSSYAYTQNDDTLWFHLYVGSVLTKMVGDQALDIQVQTQAPWGGETKVRFQSDEPVRATLAFRYPSWCSRMTITEKKSGQHFVINQSGLVDSEAASSDIEATYADGYVYLTAAWQPDLELFIDTPTQERMIISNPKVSETYGQVALQRGPIVYCMEEVDNGDNLHLFSLVPGDITAQESTEFGHLTVNLTAKGYRKQFPQFVADAASESKSDPLYQTYQPTKRESVNLRFVPYYAWNNRKEGEMRVWVPFDDSPVNML